MSRILWEKENNTMDWSKSERRIGKDRRAQRAEVVAPQWVLVVDRAPEGNGSVLCAGLDPDNNYWREICSAKWVRESAPAGFATHWMPLPSPPMNGERK
jgi:hypothetical protein